MRKLTEFFIGSLLARQRDEFSRARVRLTFNFSFFYSLMVALSIPAAFSGPNPWLVFWNNTTVFALHLVPLLLLKVGSSHRSAATFFCVVAYLSATSHSIRLAGDLSPVILSWYFLLIIFAHFTLGGRYTAGFIAVTFATITLIVVVRLNAPELFPFPPAPERAVLIMVPFVLGFGLLAIGMLLREFSRTSKYARDALQESNRAKDHILGTVAHDLRNPISAIKSIASLLAYLPEDRRNQSLPRRLEQIDTSCEAAEGIINDLIEASELDQVETEMRMERIDLRPFVISAVELCRTQALNKRITVDAKMPAADLPVLINKVKFSRVLDNLLSNALKFCNEDGTVVVTVETTSKCARLTVADNGIGIPDNLKERVFERFSDAGRPGTAQERSTGLGLSITRQIVRLHGGQIWLESREHEGTTFYVEIPLGRNVTGDTATISDLCSDL